MAAWEETKMSRPETYFDQTQESGVTGLKYFDPVLTCPPAAEDLVMGDFVFIGDDGTCVL